MELVDFEIVELVDLVVVVEVVVEVAAPALFAVASTHFARFVL